MRSHKLGYSCALNMRPSPQVEAQFSVRIMGVARGIPIQTSLILNLNTIQLHFERELPGVFPETSHLIQTQEYRERIRCNSTCLICPPLRMETHAVGFQLTLLELS